jgi:hypothetical protein
MHDDGGFTKAGDVVQQMLGFADRDVGPNGVRPGRALLAPTESGESPAFSVDALLSLRPALRQVLNYNDLLVAREIERHIGQPRAIRIRDLATMLGENWNDRAIKDVVDRLRSLAHMPIGSTKAPPYGLFMPSTPEEAKEIHDRLFGEGIRLIVHSQLFGKDRDLVRQLEGQLELKVKG